MSEVLLRFNNVGKRFVMDAQKRTFLQWLLSGYHAKPRTQDFWALKNITLEVRRGEKIALIGRNGAGKTVLLRIAAGIFAPTEGTVFRACPITPLFRYGLGTDSQLSVVDSIFVAGAFYGLLKKEVKEKLDEILAYSELKQFAHVHVRNLSAGQIQRLHFSIFIHAKSNFLAFDESIVFSDLNFEQKTDQYFEKMMHSDKTVIMASHTLSKLTQYCQHAIWIEKGHIVDIGPAASVIEKYRQCCLNNQFDK